MRDTMFPEKPEDYELAIPHDKKALKKEVESMIDTSIGYHEDIQDLMTQLPWLEKNKKLQNENIPKTIKCTCPIKLSTKKRKKDKSAIVIQKVNNGYFPFCPVHTKL